MTRVGVALILGWVLWMKFGAGPDADYAPLGGFDAWRDCDDSKKRIAGRLIREGERVGIPTALICLPPGTDPRRSVQPWPGSKTLPARP